MLGINKFLLKKILVLDKCCQDMLLGQISSFYMLSGMIALLVITAMGCGMQNLCRSRNREEEEETSSLGYSVAVSNSMFREER